MPAVSEHRSRGLWPRIQIRPHPKHVLQGKSFVPLHGKISISECRSVTIARMNGFPQRPPVSTSRPPGPADRRKPLRRYAPQVRCGSAPRHRAVRRAGPLPYGRTNAKSDRPAGDIRRRVRRAGRGAPRQGCPRPLRRSRGPGHPPLRPCGPDRPPSAPGPYGPQARRRCAGIPVSKRSPPKCRRGREG